MVFRDEEGRPIFRKRYGVDETAPPPPTTTITKPTPKPRPTITERTLIQKQLAQARTPQEKSYYLELLRQRKRERELQRQYEEDLREAGQQEEIKEGIITPEVPEGTMGPIEQKYRIILSTDPKTGEIKYVDINYSLYQNLVKYNLLEQYKQVLLGNVDEKTFQDQYKEQYKQDLRNQGKYIAELKTSELEDVYKAFNVDYQKTDVGEEEWSTLILDDKAQWEELANMMLARRRAEDTWNKITKEMGIEGMLEAGSLALRQFVDLTVVAKLSGLLGDIASGRLTREEAKEKAIGYIAQSYYSDYAFKKRGLPGILEWTLRAPIVQYGATKVAMGGIGFGAGWLSKTIPSVGKGLQYGLTTVGIGALGLMGKQAYESYQKEGFAGATATVASYVPAFVGGYQGFKAGYSAGAKAGAGARRLSITQYKPETLTFKKGFKFFGKDIYYGKEQVMTPREAMWYRMYYAPKGETWMGQYEQPQLPQYTQTRTDYVSYKPFTYDLATGKGYSTKLGVDWVLKGDTYVQRLNYPPSTKVLPKPTYWYKPRPPSIWEPEMPILPLTESGGIPGIFESEFRVVRPKPKIITFKDLVKKGVITEPKSYDFRTTGGTKQQTIQIQKQIAKTKTKLKTINQQLKQAQQQALKLKRALQQRQTQQQLQMLRQQLLQLQQQQQVLLQQRRQLQASLSALEQQSAQLQKRATTEALAFAPVSIQAQEKAQLQASTSFYAPLTMQKYKKAKIGLPLFSSEEKKKPKKQESYHVYVDGRKRTTRPLKKQTALGMGADITDKTVATRFKLKKSSQPPTTNLMYSNRWNQIKYKFNKRNSTYYEKKQYQKDYNIEKGFYVTEKTQKPSSKTKSMFFNIIGGKKK